MRKTIAVISGAIIGSVTLFIVGIIANAVNPTPSELMDPKTPEAVAERVASTNVSTWLTVIAGLALGSFLGGLTGAKIAGEKIFLITSVIALVLSLWAFYTFYIVFPMWLWVPLVMLFSAFLFSYFGGILELRRQKKRKTISIKE